MRSNAAESFWPALRGLDAQPAIFEEQSERSELFGIIVDEKNTDAGAHGETLVVAVASRNT
jgi:hypothetical protein